MDDDPLKSDLWP